MEKFSGNRIRQIWLDFFKRKNHYVVESKSLVPVNDNSLLWINSGVATLKNYFSGKSIPPAPRLTNSQRCIRTNDIENVGVTSRHQTLFEMMGNFSIGDYFKKEAIEFAFELLTKDYGISKDKLYITVYEDDDEAYDSWVRASIDPSHIVRCGRDRNFWDLGQGPCGPCTEIYYDRGPKYDPENLGERLFFEDIENDRYIEIWNIVFSQFNNDGQGNYSELARKNIDTGSGLERFASVLQDAPTNFDTDLFLPIIREIQNHSPFEYVVDDYFSDDQERKRTQTRFRVIADHMKAVVFAISDGVVPGPKGRNYTIRRLIRRVVLYTKKLNIKGDAWAKPVIEKIIELYCDFFKELKNKQKQIVTTLGSEINSYSRTLDKAFALFKDAIAAGTLTTASFFTLVETHGLPVEFAREFLDDAVVRAESDLNQKIGAVRIDWDEFDELFRRHQLISKNLNQGAAIEKQNENLIRCEIPSRFDYDAQETKGTVVALFDEQFNPQTSVSGPGYVMFDKTVIYATSGGQRHDEGHAERMGAKVRFDNVLKAPNLQHLHHFENASFGLGEEWTVRHDPEWRRMVRKNHSLEHVMHSALKKVISETIKQEGAYKSAEKATLDFTHPVKLTDDEIERIEAEIRRVIKAAIPVEIVHTDLEGSMRMNAIAYFDDEYKKHDKLRVVKMGDYSVELCGGTHVANTSEIEECHITHLSSHGVGSWRIEIISGFDTIKRHLAEQSERMRAELDQMRKEAPGLGSEQLAGQIERFHLPEAIGELRRKQRAFGELVDAYRKAKADKMRREHEAQSETLKNDLAARIADGVSVIQTDGLETKEISMGISSACNEHQDVLFVVLNRVRGGETQYFAAIKKPTGRFDANAIVRKFNERFGGKGGGKPNYAQGGCGKAVSVQDVLALL